MDFDDLLFYTFLLFRDRPEVLARYRSQFRYILVDEYQDTNFAQHSIVLQLAKSISTSVWWAMTRKASTPSGEPTFDNILYFTKVYSGTKVFKLEQNYRSTQTIVSAANSLIEKNQRQIRKEVFSEKDKGEPIGVYQAYSDVEEGDIVINKIANCAGRRITPIPILPYSIAPTRRAVSLRKPCASAACRIAFTAGCLSISARK